MLIENSYVYPVTPQPLDVQNFLRTVIAEIDNAEDEFDWRDKIQSCVDRWLVA
jgi:hypothetical protein